MPELPGSSDFVESTSVNPFEIGKRAGEVVVPTKVTTRDKLRKIFGFAKSKEKELKDNELTDLLKIDPGKVTLDDINEYVAGSIAYFESWGEVRFKPSQQQKFDEARELKLRLDARDYKTAAAFFLRKARENWDSTKYTRGDDEMTWRIIGSNDAVNVPQEVIMQGDTAIKNFHNKEGHGLSLRMAAETSSMYLRQAAVLARAIKEQEKEEVKGGS